MFTESPAAMAVPSLPFVTPELARSARDHFQRLYAEPQTEEDGREMATNVLGAFGVLNEWRQRRAARLAAAATATSGPPLAPDSPSPSTQE